MQVFTEVLNREEEDQTGTVHQENEEVKNFGSYESENSGFNFRPSEPEVIETIKTDSDFNSSDNKATSEGASYFSDPEVGSEMIAGMFDLVLSNVCSAISGNPVEDHKLGRLENKQLKKSLELYIRTSSPSGNVSPAKVLFLTIVIIAGMSIFSAFKEKRKNKGERKQRQNYREKVSRGEIIDTEFEEIDSIQDFERKMGKFQIDEDGLYKYDENGKRRTNQEKRDDPRRPSPRILELIEDGKTGWEIKNFIKLH